MLNTINLLRNVFDCEISELTMEVNRDTKHFIKHKYREEVIVPMNAITNNVDFFFCKGEKTIFTIDNVECIVTDWKQVHVCELEEKIQNMYKMNTWDFIKRWYNNDKHTQSLSFVVLTLRKKDEH